MFLFPPHPAEIFPEGSGNLPAADQEGDRLVHAGQDNRHMIPKYPDGLRMLVYP